MAENSSVARTQVQHEEGRGDLNLRGGLKAAVMAGEGKWAAGARAG